MTMKVTARMAVLLCWAFVLLAHLVPLTLGLAALWWFQVSPSQVAQAAQHLFPAAWRATAGEILGLLGLSALALLSAYAAAARWLLQKLVDRFLLDFD